MFRLALLLLLLLACGDENPKACDVPDAGPFFCDIACEDSSDCTSGSYCNEETGFCDADCSFDLPCATGGCAGGRCLSR